MLLVSLENYFRLGTLKSMTFIKNIEIKNVFIFMKIFESYKL